MEIGAEHPSPSLWRFHVETTDQFNALLERLVFLSDPQTLNDTLALTLEAESRLLVLDALTNAMPFNTLYARHRYPWMLEHIADRIEIHFQPIVDMQGGGHIFAFEALCRVRNPAGSLLNGVEVFRLTSQLNRQDEVDLLCQRMALRRKAAEIPPGMPVFLNVMPTTILHESWVTQFIASLHELEIDPRDVIIEVVESERVDAALLATRCETLRRAGLRIALDDMGSGFNGLTILSMVRAEFIKIDRPLVHEAQGSRVRAVMLESLVSMAARLGAKVVAEGLERAEDVGFCQSMGIGLGQGFFFFQPEYGLQLTPFAMPELDDAWSARPQEIFRLSDLVEPGGSIELHAGLQQAKVLFEDSPGLSWLVVLDQGRPVGLLSRGHALAHNAWRIGLACQPLRRVLTTTINVVTLARSLYVSSDGTEPWVIIGSDGYYLGIVQPMALVTRILSHHDYGSNLHPLSQLPTGPGLRQSIDSRLDGTRNMHLVYIDLDHFKSFNDRYGFIRGDAMIRTLAEILRHLFIGNTNHLLGHIGGDDFILIADDENDRSDELKTLLESAIVQFHALARHLYDAEDISRGFFVTEDGQRHPVASVSVAVVNGRTGRPANSIEAAERAAALKKVGKSEWGSVIVIEDIQTQVCPISVFDDIDTWRDNAFSALDTLAQHTRGCDPHCLDDAFKAFPFFEVVFELDAYGIQRHPNWINPAMYGRIRAGGVGADRGGQKYFSAVSTSGQRYVSTIYLSSASEDFCLTLAAPLFDSQGTADGVLVADLNLSAMAALVDKRPALVANWSDSIEKIRQ